MMFRKNLRNEKKNYGEEILTSDITWSCENSSQVSPWPFERDESSDRAPSLSSRSNCNLAKTFTISHYVLQTTLVCHGFFFVSCFLFHYCKSLFYCELNFSANLILAFRRGAAKIKFKFVAKIKCSLKIGALAKI